VKALRSTLIIVWLGSAAAVAAALVWWRLRKLVRHGRGIQYVEHSEGDGVEMFKAICKLGLEGIVSKKLDSPYKTGPSKAWLKIENPKAPAFTRAADGTF
jgi:hypothetical protein